MDELNDLPKKRGAYFEVDETGAMHLYVERPNGEVIQLSPDQQQFLRAAVVLKGEEIQPGGSVVIQTGDDALAALLSWPVERVRRTALELQQLGVLEVNEQPRAPEEIGRTLVRALRPEERADFSACVKFCQAEPLPTNDAETEQRLRAAAEKWPHIMELFGGWMGDHAQV